jgi:hypothetical protein
LWWYIGHDHTRWSCPPWTWKCPNISKTVKIPTPKPYISLILVPGDIWWYVDHGHMGWSHPPPWNESALIYQKPLSSPPLNHTYSCLLCQGTSDCI